MRFLHWELNLNNGDVLQVQLDKQANVRLLDDFNFSAYRSGRQHRYHGGLAKQSTIRLPAPHAGRWHVVVDLGGYAGSVQASVSVIRSTWTTIPTRPSAISAARPGASN